ncbi:proton channel OtopLc-like isoform X2 [Phymastichus coffea]|uniref:proton channel OtopLc-like isoform X2 n=1 Tax=Phymastichus coffea TaxID=108790 RepID=UPI00273AB4E8|nr:proton channel OtopLc-like isoform X2 [Phymastichus coffea]
MPFATRGKHAFSLAAGSRDIPRPSRAGPRDRWKSRSAGATRCSGSLSTPRSLAFGRVRVRDFRRARSRAHGGRRYRAPLPRRPPASQDPHSVEDREKDRETRRTRARAPSARLQRARGSVPGMCAAVTKAVIGLVGPYRVEDPRDERPRSRDQQSTERPDGAPSGIEAAADERSSWMVMGANGFDDSPPGGVRQLANGEEDAAWQFRSGGKLLAVRLGSEERAVDVANNASSTVADAGNDQQQQQQQHDKDSLNETGSTAGGTADAGPGGGELAGNGNAESPGRDASPRRSHSPSPKSLVSRILARSRTPDDLLDHSEPFSQLWVVLSNVYGELLIVLTMALCLAEVMDTPVPLLSLQGVFLIYMYVGSIAVIIAIYIWVLIDSCGSMRSAPTAGFHDAELGGASLTRFGSLKLAHISRSRTTPTSFYIRIGALLFGLATLVFNGLEMAMHSMAQAAECFGDIVFVHPALHGLFTFLQMHFLFVNSQVLVEKFGPAARFGFTHLAATNVAVWARLVIWDSAQEWTYHVHVAQRGALRQQSPLELRRFPDAFTKLGRALPGDEERAYERQPSAYHRYEPISQEQISQVVALQECLNTNALGQLWTSSMPFLYPFIVQFSLIAAAVAFVMGRNVGRSGRLLRKKLHGARDAPGARLGCDSSSKGLFLGILCMVAGIVVILIFLVIREDEHFTPATLSWLTCGSLAGILSLSSLVTCSGLLQVRRMSVVSAAPAQLDSLLSNVALFGVQLYSVFTIVVCACSLHSLEDADGRADGGGESLADLRARHTMLLAVSVLQLFQCFAQSTLIAEAAKRCCITRSQMTAKPARQIITYLLFSNAVLWAFDTVITQTWISQELQLNFFGILAWGVISRIGLPLLIFYRFHSCVMLLEAWNKCYRTLNAEHPFN